MNNLWKIKDQYVVIKKIGEGGFATVYKAADIMLRKFVAVKQIKQEYVKNTKIIDLFRQEAINTAKLEHKNIVKVISFINEGEESYIILDYVNGVDLEYMIKKANKKGRGCSPGLATYIMYEILKALAYAHDFRDELTGESIRFVHSDISPGNIMLYYDGKIKLTDFGIANVAGTVSEGIRGKISYVSPEQVQGEKTTTSSDLFSCGLVLYEAITGKKAYEGNTSEKLKQAKKADINIDELSKKEVPQELIKIVKKLLKKDPRQRYQSAKECLRDIEEYLNTRKGLEEWGGDYKSFLNEMLEKEKKKADEELKEEAKIDYQSVKSGPPPFKRAGGEMQEEEKTEEEPAKKKEPEEEKPGQVDEEEKEAEAEEEPAKKKEPEEEKPIRKKKVRKRRVRKKRKRPVKRKKSGKKKEEKEEKPSLISRILSFLKLSKSEEKPAEEKPGQVYGEEKETETEGEPAEKKRVRRKIKSPVKEERKPSRAVKIEKPEKEHEEKEKTVIDFVLDTALKYKKLFITLTLSFITAAVIFTILDTYMQLTPMGVNFHNIIWPPALTIDTLPSGSRIRIIDENNVDIVQEEGFRRTTPSYISEIPPGTYTLRVSRDEFGEMTRIITVHGEKTARQQISVAGARIEDDVHVVPYEVRVDVNSIPSEAVLFINGKNVGRTPFSGDLEIKRHSLQLVKEGFEELGVRRIPDTMQPGVCVIDTSRAAGDQDMVDRRFWEISQERLSGRKKKVDITGKPWKYITVESEPVGADAFITEAETGQQVRSDTTPMEDLKLTSGDYNLRVEKEGYETRESSLQVDAETENIQMVRLNKYVTVNALQRGTDRRINANITIDSPSIDTIGGQTPIKVALPLEDVRFSLSREPSYVPVNITRDVKDLREIFNIRMRLRPPHLTLNVEHYETGEAIGQATVWINGMYWKRAGSAGRVSDYIEEPPGEYTVEVRSDDYEDYRTRKIIYRGQRKHLTVRLGAPQDGTAKLDIPEEYSIESVEIGQVKVEPDADKVISNIARGSRYIEIKLQEREEKVSGSFSLTQPEEVVVLKLDEETMSLRAMKPPAVSVNVATYEDEVPVEGADIWLGDELIGTTDEGGSYFSYVMKPEGKYVLTVEKESMPDTKTAAVLANDKTEEIRVKVDSPTDGTIILDIAEEIYDAAVYFNGEYRGDNVKMLSNIPRARHLVEIISPSFPEGVSKTVEIDETKTLTVLTMYTEEGEMVLEERDPSEYLD